MYDYLFNVINVHLVHGEKRFDKRNEMMSELIKKMRMHRDEIDPDMIADYNFIVGDMNYRMKGTYEQLAPQAEKLIEMRKELDQLYLSMNELKKYPDYHEFDINFLPSYKHNKFEDGYFNKKN
jgi:hypothetical protein